MYPGIIIMQRDAILRFNMNAAASCPLRIQQNLIELANLGTKKEHVDISTALRQLLYMGAQDYVTGLYGKGRISLSKATPDSFRLRTVAADTGELAQHLTMLHFLFSSSGSRTGRGI